MSVPTIQLVFDKTFHGQHIPNGMLSKYIESWKSQVKHHPHAFNVLTRFFCSDDNLYGYFPLVLEKSSYSYSMVNIKDISRDNVNWLVVEPSDIDHSFVVENCLTALTDDSLDAIRSGAVMLVIYYAYEAFPFAYREFMSTLERSLAYLRIPPSRVVLVFGDEKVRDNYCQYADTHMLYYRWNEEHLISFQHFEIEFYHYVHNLLKDPAVASQEIVSCQESIRLQYRPNTFLCLNGGGRKHRRYFLAEMFRTGIHKHALVSYLRKYEEPVNQAVYLRSDDPKYREKVKFHDEWGRSVERLVLPDDNPDGQWHNRGMIASHYSDTYFSIVTETFPDRPCFFLTEKVFKPIINLHPFVIVGAPKSLKQIKRLGYETFPEIFNESYDDIESDGERMDFIISDIVRVMNNKTALHKKYCSVWDKLKHNRQIFLNKTFTDEVDELVTTLLTLSASIGQ